MAEQMTECTFYVRTLAPVTNLDDTPRRGPTTYEQIHETPLLANPPMIGDQIALFGELEAHSYLVVARRIEIPGEGSHAWPYGDASPTWLMATIIVERTPELFADQVMFG